MVIYALFVLKGIYHYWKCVAFSTELKEMEPSQKCSLCVCECFSTIENYGFGRYLGPEIGDMGWFGEGSGGFQKVQGLGDSTWAFWCPPVFTDLWVLGAKDEKRCQPCLEASAMNMPYGCGLKPMGCHFGVGALHLHFNFSGDWDVHR